VNALANDRVGGYVNEHFVSSFLKVGTFTVNGAAKQGGNVASYFCLPDGSVLHAIAGPVDADTFLKEARWVVDTRKVALFEAQGNATRYKELFRQAHYERLLLDPNGRNRRGQGLRIPAGTPLAEFPAAADRAALARIELQLAQQHQGLPAGTNEQRVHQLLANYPLVKIERVYRYVFERILNERVSTLPVVQR